MLPNPLHDDQTQTGTSTGRRGGGLQRLHSIRLLAVSNCPEFLSSYSSPSSSSFPFPTCLQDLTLEDMKHMQTLQALSNLTSLTKLRLRVLGDSRNEGLWPLLAHGRLAKLTLHTESDFFAGSNPSRPHDKEVFSRSSKLFDLSTTNNTGVLAAPICGLLSSTLTRFELRCEDEVECLTKEQEVALHLLTNLQQLVFWTGRKLRHLPAGLHKLISLKKLEILWCFAIQSLPSLPTSLQELKIHECRSIESLPNNLPGSLEKLKISACFAIKSLPKDDLPSSLLELDVHYANSEELKRDCCKFIGTIPIVRT